MRSLDRIGEFAQLVCRQIRWEKAHARVSEEITNHIIDGRDAYIAQGMEEDAATERALADTGDAMAIGTQLDRIHRPKPQWSMLIATAILVMFGILIRLFFFNDVATGGLLSVRLIFTAFGIAGMIGAYYADFTIIAKYPRAIYFGTVIGTIALFFVLTYFSQRIYSVSRIFGEVKFPSYIIMLSPIVFVSLIFSFRSKGYRGAIIYGLAFLPIGWFAIGYTFLGGFFSVTVIWFILFGIAVNKNWFGTKKLYNFLIILVPPVLLLFLLFALNWDMCLRWIKAAIDPYADPVNIGYWGTIARGALSGAQFFGGGQLPEAVRLQMSAKNTFFCANLLLVWLIAHIGWVAFALIMAVPVFFIIKGFRRCMRQRSSLGLFVSLAVMMSLSAQSFGYVVYNLGFQLGRPISLPLISYGNGELVINLVMIGFMISVFRTGDLVVDKGRGVMQTHL